MSSDVYTGEQTEQYERPFCPVCAATCEVVWLDVTTRWHFEQTGERLYMVSHWLCPHGCNPETGERQHLTVSWGSEVNGYWLACSCGVMESAMSSDQLDAALAEHQVK